MRRYLLAATTALSAIVAVAPAHAQATNDTAAPAKEAQGGIEEIIVTAQRRAESVQDVPIAISAFTADQLRNQGVSNTLELGRFGVRVNAVAPGTVRTPMTENILGIEKLRARIEGEVQLGRLGEVEDIAQAVAFLAGPEASWITGKVLTVDGGAYN